MEEVVERLKAVSLRGRLPDDVEMRATIHMDAPLATIKLATVYAFKVLADLNESIHFGAMINLLRPLYEFHAPASLWLVKYIYSSQETLLTLLLARPSTDIRESFCNLLKTALRVCFHAEEQLFGEFDELPQLQTKKEPGYPPIVHRPEWKSVLQRFIYFRLLHLEMYSKIYWKHFTQYYKIIREVARLHHLVSKYLIHDIRYIRYILEFLCSKQHTTIFN